MYFPIFFRIFARNNMKYSIITINYNNKRGLFDTMNSIINQSCNDYEYIIIDGGSTDGSTDVIKEYESLITYWSSEKDKGVYHAMNKGIAQAHGDYCIFINSGDCFYDNHVLEGVASLEAEEDIIVGKVIVSENDKIQSPPPSGELTMYHLFSGAIPHQGAFIRTSLLLKYPYDEKLKISSDWKFFVQTLILDNCSIRYIDEYIAKYDTDGISSSNPDLMQKEREEYLKQILPPRILADYQLMKASECKTQALTPLLRKNYSVDILLYRIGLFLLKIKRAIR